MNQKPFILGIVVIVIAFIFVLGGIAIYASATPDGYAKKDTNKKTYTYTNAGSPSSQMVVNKYYQQPSQPTTALDCQQQVTSYYNNQPVTNCVPYDTPSAVNTPSQQQITKVNVQVSSAGYYPYPYRYYKPYYHYPYYPHYKYNPYPYDHPYKSDWDWAAKFW